MIGAVQRRSSPFRLLGHPLVRFAWVSGGLLAGGWIWGALVGPGHEGREETEAMEIAGSLPEQAPVADLSVETILVREVDYLDRSGSWTPKSESPVLTELVTEGKLPPLAERITTEPLVLAGVDGIGRYGGNWIDAVTWDSQVWDRMNRYNAGVTLARWSPDGYPIGPHVAKSWDSSPDHRRWTFHLRPGMKWSDGFPFTADDFVYWFEWEVLYFQQLGYPLHDDSFLLLSSGEG